MYDDRSGNWPERYRPRALDDLVGQQKAVARVRALIQEPRHVILSGDTGVGKTTIALAYAQSLMCGAERLGTACGECDSCLNFLAGHHPNFYHKNSADVTPEWLRAVLGETSGTPFIGRRHVFILDESHLLSPYAREALLQPMESRAERTFIFTLIDIGALPEQLRARCQEIELAAATIDSKVEYARRITKAEQLEIGSEAAELLAHFSSGYRSVARNLQSVHESCPILKIGLDQVRSTVLQDRSERMLELLAALASGSWAGAASASQAVRLGAWEKRSALLDVLMYLKLKYVGPALSDERRFDLLFRRGDCLRVLDLWDARAAAHGITLASLFDEVLEFWAFMPLNFDEQLFRVQLIRLYDLVNVDRRNHVGDEPTDWSLRREQCFRSTAAGRPQPRFRSLARRDADPDEHLSGGIIRRLYEPATFLPQATGCWLNALVEMRFSSSGEIPDHSAASRFGKQLAARLAAWGGEVSAGTPKLPLHRITVLEGHDDGDLTAMMVFHLADDVLERAREWLGRYRAKVLEEAGAAAFYLDLPTAGRGAARQWALMRQLWRGIDPSLLLEEVPAFERLRIPKSQLRPAGRVPKGRRYNLSHSLSPEERKRQADKGMPHLSAWDDGVWDELFSGWEAMEYKERTAEVRRRERTLAQLEHERLSAGDALHRRALERIILDERESWPADPHLRPRTRKLWW